MAYVQFTHTHVHKHSDELSFGDEKWSKHTKEQYEIWTPCWVKWIVSVSRNLLLEIYHIKITPTTATKLQIDKFKTFLLINFVKQPDIHAFCFYK